MLGAGQSLCDEVGMDYCGEVDQRGLRYWMDRAITLLAGWNETRLVHAALVIKSCEEILCMSS